MRNFLCTMQAVWYTRQMEIKWATENKRIRGDER